MKSMQDRVLDRVEDIITGAGLEPTIKKAFGNTGIVYAMDRKFTTWVELTYNFQDFYATFRMSGPGIYMRHNGKVNGMAVRADRTDGNASWHMLKYIEADRIQEMFTLLARAATGGDPDAVAKALAYTREQETTDA